MNIKKLLPFTLAFIITGCLPVWSLHPLYDDKHIVFDEKLLGTFTENKEDTILTWEFTRAVEPNTYRLIYSSLSKEEPNAMKGLFEAHLVKLNGHFFMDIYPKEAPWGNDNEYLNRLQWPFNSFFIIPVHTFIKVEILESELKIRLSDDDNFKKLLKADPNAVKYELANDSYILTASTQQLQSFVLKFADSNQFFSDEHTLIRKTSKPAGDSNEPKTATPDVNNIIRDSNNLSV
jgi:hypothetical protein